MFPKWSTLPKYCVGQHGQRGQGNEEHRRHARLVNRHALFDERHGNAAAINAADDGHAIDDERRHHDLLLGHVELLDQIIRQPEQVKPPDAVGHEFAEKEGPGLAVAKEPPPGNLRLCRRWRRWPRLHRRCEYNRIPPWKAAFVCRACHRARTRKSARENPTAPVRMKAIFQPAGRRNKSCTTGRTARRPWRRSSNRC